MADDMKNTAIRIDRKLMPWLHLLVWSILFVVPVYILFLETSKDYHFLAFAYSQIVFYAIIFYLNYLWLAPAFYLRGKRTLYFVMALMLIVTVTLTEEIIHETTDPHRGIERQDRILPPPYPGRPSIQEQPPPIEQHPPFHPLNKMPFYNFLLTSFFITGFGLGLRLYGHVVSEERIRKESEKEQLNSELSFLKNQINPHFFFNTLNNIYSLVEIDVDTAQKAILDLSKLMRYLLYETEKGDKPISEEIRFMLHYIAIMQLRLSDKVDLKVDFPEGDPDIQIPPLLFLPFIENAFKHGISNRRPSFIHIRMAVTDEIIRFECSNSLGSGGDELFRSGQGIGLDNVRKRLMLLFPARHHLETNMTALTYDVALTIQLQPHTES